MVPLSSMYDSSSNGMSGYPGHNSGHSATHGHNAGHVTDNNNMDRLLAGKSGYHLGLTNLNPQLQQDGKLHDSKMTSLHQLHDSCWSSGYIDTAQTKRQKSQVSEEQPGINLVGHPVCGDVYLYSSKRHL